MTTETHPHERDSVIFSVPAPVSDNIAALTAYVQTREAWHAGHATWEAVTMAKKACIGWDDESLESYTLGVTRSQRDFFHARADYLREENDRQRGVLSDLIEAVALALCHDDPAEAVAELRERWEARAWVP